MTCPIPVGHLIGKITASVARMERSAIRAGIDASRQSRITLRSIRATALHPPLQGEGRPPQAGGVGCAAMPLHRAPVYAVTPPAALRASTSPSRGRWGNFVAAVVKQERLLRQRIFVSEIRFVPFGHGGPRKFIGSHARNARFSIAYGRASGQFHCCLTPLPHPLTGAPSRPRKGTSTGDAD
jgi:hypothetical protein